MSLISRIFAVIMVLFLPVATLAEEPILTLTANGEVKVFDLQAIQAFESTSFTTTTIWTTGTQTFTGVSLVDFLADYNLDFTSLKATAINSYAIEIPVTDIVANGAIIAYLKNGRTMSVREKGPLWIVYPYDSIPDYQSEVIYSRSIWQLDRLEVQR